MTSRGGRRGWMLVLGVVVIVGALGVAVAMWLAGASREADNVAGFARAPVGCDTTLDFESTGTFLLYVETSGQFGELAGACDAPARYDRDADDVPAVEMTLIDPDGDVIDLDDPAEVGYDVDGFVGTSIAEVEIETEGDHVLTVAPTEGDAFAVAVGRRPDEGVALAALGRRRGRSSAASCSAGSCSCSAVVAHRSRRHHRRRGLPMEAAGRRAHPDSRFRRRRPGPPDPQAHQPRPTADASAARLTADPDPGLTTACSVAVGSAAGSVAPHHRDDLAVDLDVVGGEVHRFHRGVRRGEGDLGS